MQRLGTTAGTATVDYKIEAGTATPPRRRTWTSAVPACPLTGTLTFTPGQSSRTFTVPIVNDAQVEGPETILLSLHHPTGGRLLGAQPTAVVTIVNNDVAGTSSSSARRQPPPRSSRRPSP